MDTFEEWSSKGSWSSWGVKQAYTVTHSGSEKILGSGGTYRVQAKGTDPVLDGKGALHWAES